MRGRFEVGWPGVVDAGTFDCSVNTSKDVADYLGLAETKGGGSYPCTFSLTCGTLTTTATALLIQPEKQCFY